MPDPGRGNVTRTLQDLTVGCGDAEELATRLYGQVYEELRRIATGLMRGERPNHTLQSTALVNEAYLQLAGGDKRWESRAHFFGAASRAMRQILVDHARRASAAKRGGGQKPITLEDDMAINHGLSIDLLALEEALDKLADQHTRMARVVEMRVFSGMISRDVALVLNVSKRTVDEDWKVAKLFLTRELSGDAAS